MKKITLLALLFVASIGYSQTVIWEDDFNDEDVSDWTLYDEDGDAFNWDVYQITNQGGGTVTPISLISRSWIENPLMPDNWAVSPAIDLTGEDGSNTITLSWLRQVNSDFPAETYTVYVSDSDDITVMENATVTLTESFLVPSPETDTPKTITLDISQFAGQTIHLAFRHYDSFDADYLSIDDVTVTAEPNASNDQFASHNFKFYNTSEVLNLSASTNIDSVEIFNALGQKVGTHKLGSMNSEINISNLASGLFIAKVSIGNSSETFKFVK